MAKEIASNVGNVNNSNNSNNPVSVVASANSNNNANNAASIANPANVANPVNPANPTKIVANTTELLEEITNILVEPAQTSAATIQKLKSFLDANKALLTKKILQKFNKLCADSKKLFLWSAIDKYEREHLSIPLGKEINVPDLLVARIMSSQAPKEPAKNLIKSQPNSQKKSQAAVPKYSPGFFTNVGIPTIEEFTSQIKPLKGKEIHWKIDWGTESVKIHINAPHAIQLAIVEDPQQKQLTIGVNLFY